MKYRLQDNLASLELSLAADQWKTLDEDSRIELGFPQELFTRELPRRLRGRAEWRTGSLRERLHFKKIAPLL